MKKLFQSTIAFVAISLSSSAQINMNSIGDVTIVNRTGGSVIIDHSGYGSMPAIYSNNNNCISIGKSDRNIYQGYFRYLWVNGVSITSSDERLKKNKRKLENSLTKVLKLGGYKYDLALDDSITDFDQFGFLAQDLLKTVPEVVVYDTLADKYGINYIAIIPLLVEALKEQQLMIEELSKSKNTKKSASLGIEYEESYGNNLLYQNMPNPFTKNTEIKYALAGNVKSAMLNIYNLNGTQLKTIPINQTGNGSVTINGSEFSAGMYLYALIADGNIVDTKQMVLTE